MNVEDPKIQSLLDLALQHNSKHVTEDSAALAFKDRHRDKLRFDHDIGKWYTWTGKRWKVERTQLAFCWARDLARELVRAAPDKVRFMSSKTSFAAGVERFARADREFAVTSEIWDTYTYLLGTPNGVFDLQHNKTLRPDPEMFITKTTAVDPAKTADCPLWKSFLRQATAGDNELIAFLQAFCGYALTGSVREHALLFIYGPGGNGKGVFLNTVTSIFGDYARTASMDTFILQSGSQHPTDLAMLKGARMVCASETEEGRAWAESRIKTITGGDPIAARFMRQDFFEYRPEFKLVIIGNHKPTLRNCDDAARRRFNMVPFIHKPTKPDKELADKLKPEWPAILRWMLDGCATWLKTGLARPPIVTAATNEYFSEQDLVRVWIDECCETGPRSFEDTHANLFSSWKAWADRNGERPGSSKWFTQTMERHGFYRDRTKAERLFRCIRVKPGTQRGTLL